MLTGSLVMAAAEVTTGSLVTVAGGCDGIVGDGGGGGEGGV